MYTFRLYLQRRANQCKECCIKHHRTITVKWHIHRHQSLKVHIINSTLVSLIACNCMVCNLLSKNRLIHKTRSVQSNLKGPHHWLSLVQSSWFTVTFYVLSLLTMVMNNTVLWRYVTMLQHFPFSKKPLPVKGSGLHVIQENWHIYKDPWTTRVCPLKWNVIQFSCFCTVHPCAQCAKDRHTDHMKCLTCLVKDQ